MDVLDEPILHEEGFPLALAFDVIEVMDKVEQTLFFPTQLSGRHEIARNAIGKTAGLPDVNDPASVVFHQINAGDFGKFPSLVEERFEPFTSLHEEGL